MDRRAAIGFGVSSLALLARGAAAQEAAPSSAAPAMMTDGPSETLALWPGVPPGGDAVHLDNHIVERAATATAPLNRSIDQIGTPGLMVFRPDKPDGSALIIAPGGGYLREGLGGEGFDTARWFNGAGVTCFVLNYRLPGEGWADRADVPLQDAQRAIRLVRASAAKYGIDPARIGMLGYSAGGHVAASLATRFAARVYAPLDAADALDARPSFAVLMYPVITMGAGAHAGSRERLLGADATPARAAAYSCETLVTAATPPSFVCLAADDTTVEPVTNGIAMFAALRAAKVDAELHVFEVGGHGFGIARARTTPVAGWSDLLLRWGAAHGFFTAKV